MLLAEEQDRVTLLHSYAQCKLSATSGRCQGASPSGHSLSPYFPFRILNLWDLFFSCVPKKIFSFQSPKAWAVSPLRFDLVVSSIWWGLDFKLSRHIAISFKHMKFSSV